ncbi:hypothetical protein HK405_003949, partial [Cladochytrium tenue]
MMEVTKAVGQLTNSRSKILSVAKSIDAVLKGAKGRSKDYYDVIIDHTAKSVA